MESMKNGWYPEKGTVWNVCWIFWRINRKGIAIFYHKEDRIAIFCRLKDVFCFTGDWVKSDIFQRKNGKLQQIWATNKSIGHSHLLHQNKFSACKSADDCKQFFCTFCTCFARIYRNLCRKQRISKLDFRQCVLNKKPRFSLFLSHLSPDDLKIHKALESKILQKHAPK